MILRSFEALVGIPALGFAIRRNGQYPKVSLPKSVPFSYFMLWLFFALVVVSHKQNGRQYFREYQSWVGVTKSLI